MSDMILNVISDYVCLVIIAVVAAIILVGTVGALFSYLLKRVFKAIFSEFGDDA